MVRHQFVTLPSQNKIKKGQRKSSFCSYFMAEWGIQPFCPKCRDDLKGDDPCAISADCTICSSFSDEQKRKVTNRNRYKSKKNQNSAVLLDSGGIDGSIDDSLSDEDDAPISSQVPISQKSRSLEDKLDRFFNEFANLSQRLQNLEQKDFETAGSRISSGRDSVHVARQPVAKSKAQLPSASSGVPGRLERRSATMARAEFEQQSSSGQVSDESREESRKRSFSQSSEEPDPDLEQGEIRSKD